MLMPHAGHFTAADLATIPDDGQRYEVIAGELFVTPAPGGAHQPIATRLLAPLLAYLGAHRRLDDLLTPPSDITLMPDTLVRPDLLVADTMAFICSGDWRDVTTLYLVVEIISSSTARTDRTVKRLAYQRYGVPTYWIVDPGARQIEVWTPEAASPSIHRDTLEWRHPALTMSVSIDVAALFDFG
ncbi:MAG TPA: Uma2 family endonuclease [Gemmatimonadales bacterium]|jgi:Uma2 family endonuclease